MVFYFMFLLSGLMRQPVASAQPQPIDPLTPEPNPVPQPQPLPPDENPLDDPFDAPPLPDSLLDIPGTVVVDRFSFSGNTAFTQAELNTAIASFTGRPISFADLVRAADVITQLYVKQGYITSGAYLPEQNLSSGTINIQVLEGSLAEIEVNIEGGRLGKNYIRDRLISRVSTPLNINELQSALQLLQLNPLIESLDAELSTGILPGTNSLEVSVVGADTFTLQTRLNNNRNSSIGTFERGLVLREANLFGIGDEINLGFLNTDGSNQYEAGYTLPLNSRDGTLRFDFRLTDNEIVESDFEAVDIDIESRSYNLTWRQPLVRRATPTVNQEFALNLIASRRESNTSLLDRSTSISPGVNSSGELRTSGLSFGQEWLQRNRRQVIAARSQFNFGLDIFDATVSNDEPDSEFFAWRGQFSYLRLLSTPRGNPAIGSTVLLRSQLQLAADPLIPTEQFSLGGSTTVRGYRQDALLTDSGFSAAAELRLPIARLSQLGANIQLSPFIDFGTGWNNDGEETEFNTLLGAGLGLIIQTEDRLSARVDWGFPLINHQSRNDTLQDSGVYLQMQYDLF
ncbi:MAG: ShlB/FhaC/HecB family hemolysin secretion/activation protein [Cyanobacteria bacterium P01_G01_bin.19]